MDKRKTRLQYAAQNITEGIRVCRRISSNGVADEWADRNDMASHGSHIGLESFIGGVSRSANTVSIEAIIARCPDPGKAGL